MRFSEVIGQREAATGLARMVDEGRMPNTMLFCGPHGCGKMALALALASYLLGERDDNTSPTSRTAKAMLDKWEHPDLHFVYPVIRPTGTSSDHKMTSDDFAREWRDMLAQGAYFTIDQWLTHMGATNQQAIIGAGQSDEIIHKLSLKPSQGGYKVCVVWLPERMNTECANKLLKLFEEPPMQTAIIMVCEEPTLLIDTIRSRAQRIDFKRIEDSDIERALVERRGIDTEAAQGIARLANGNWLKTLDLISTGGEGGEFLDMFKMLTRLAYTRDIKEIKHWSETVAAYGREKQIRLLGYFSRMARENFVYNFKNPDLNYMTAQEKGFSKNFARFINEGNVIDAYELFDKCRRDIRQNANAKIVFFDLALNMITFLSRK